MVESANNSSGKKGSPPAGLRVAAIALVTTFFVSISCTVLLPSIIFRPQASGNENRYDLSSDGDAVRGRQIYVREGCVYCHSQFVRLQDRGLGPVSRAGDFVFETPHQLGTARTGPDLTNEGRRFPNGWQRAHLINPRAVKPESIMPSFSYLSNRDLDDLVAYIQSLGNKRRSYNPYTPPQEYQRFLDRKKTDTSSARAAQAGRGLYIQNCSSCHGSAGQGNGTATMNMVNKPSNFTLSKYKNFSDLYWFFRISEGVPGTAMPRWENTLSEEQRWDLVAYLRTFQKQEEKTDPVLERLESQPQEMRHTHQSWEPPVSDQ